MMSNISSSTMLRWSRAAVSFCIALRPIETRWPAASPKPIACPACGGDIRQIALRLVSECETVLGFHFLGNLRSRRTSCARAGADLKDPHALVRTA